MYYLRVYPDLHRNKEKKIDTLEKIDYRDVTKIENVIEDEVIAEALSIEHLTEEEKSQVTKISNLDELKKFIGEGVFIKPNEPSRIYAKVSGQITFENGKFNIQDKIELDEINYKTGNITFAGDLYVSGDIKPGFKISARNLYIEGNVDNAQLIAGEKVIVKGGVIGLQNKDFCKIKAGKLVVLNFIENSLIESNGDVYIKKSSMHTNIYADGRVVIYDAPGLAVGGEILARNSILIKSVGSKWGTSTILKIGIDPFKYLKLKKHEQTLNSSLNLLEEVDKSIEYINSVLENEKDSTKSKEELLQELDDIKAKRAKFLKRIDRLKRLIEKLKVKIEEEKENLNLDDSKIYIFDKIYPGVEFRVGLEHHRVYEDMNGQIVALDKEGKIVFYPIN